MKWLVIEENGCVSNVIVWDGVSRLNPRGRTFMKVEDAPTGVWIGWIYSNGEWTNPYPPEVIDADE
jgi:hypothetical protein